MTKTIVNLDEDLLAACMRILGTATKVDTVNGAMAALARQAVAVELLGEAADEPGRRYLLDASAVRRLTHRAAADRVVPLVMAGLVATCGAVELELQMEAPDRYAFEQISAKRRQVYTWLRTLDADHTRAQAVYADLLDEGRRVSWPMLVVAAVAEREDVTVLHYHDAFDLIAKVTGQPVERLP
jgi:predicted nucleic acid-binding protein